MISPLWKLNLALLWSALGLPLGCVCIGRMCGWLAQALTGPDLAMDYTPFIVLGSWAVLLCCVAGMARSGAAQGRWG